MKQLKYILILLTLIFVCLSLFGCAVSEKGTTITSNTTAPDSTKSENKVLTQESASIIIKELIQKGNIANEITMCNFLSSPTSSKSEEGEYYVPADMIIDGEKIICMDDIRSLFDSTFLPNVAEQFLKPLTTGIDIDGVCYPLFREIDGVLRISTIAPANPLLLGKWDADTVKIDEITEDVITAAVEYHSVYDAEPHDAIIRIVQNNGLWFLDESFAPDFCDVQKVDKNAIITDVEKNLFTDFHDFLSIVNGNFLFSSTEEGSYVDMVNGSSLLPVLTEKLLSNHAEYRALFETQGGFIDALKKKARTLLNDDYAEQFEHAIDLQYTETDGVLYYNADVTQVYNIGEDLHACYVIKETPNMIAFLCRCIVPSSNPCYRIIYAEKQDGCLKFTFSIQANEVYHTNYREIYYR